MRDFVESQRADRHAIAKMSDSWLLCDMQRQIKRHCMPAFRITFVLALRELLGINENRSGYYIWSQTSGSISFYTVTETNRRACFLFWETIGGASWATIVCYTTPDPGDSRHCEFQIVAKFGFFWATLFLPSDGLSMVHQYKSSGLTAILA